ncbi:MAG: CZB domain-containing protein [Pseudomonadales bacterium]|nr:CZB domain-containing protein [Pseudomonadales bacterium]
MAIATGECESSPDKVCKDNNCAFGKWLHERIEPDDNPSPHYVVALKLHAEFHVEAARILKPALAGDKIEANNLIKIGSAFSKVSAELTQEMKFWQDTLH